jgi:hypothetical protein
MSRQANRVKHYAMGFFPYVFHNTVCLLRDTEVSISLSGRRTVIQTV